MFPLVISFVFCCLNCWVVLFIFSFFFSFIFSSLFFCTPLCRSPCFSIAVIPELVTNRVCVCVFHLQMKVIFVVLLGLLALSGAAFAQEQNGGGDAPQQLGPSWILPLAPAGYGGPGVISPYSNVNPLNPMAAQMQEKAGMYCCHISCVGFLVLFHCLAILLLSFSPSSSSHVLTPSSLKLK